MSLPLPPVLVVDDEKNMRLSLQTVLGDEGYPARAVESAEAALELLGQDNFLMVISDARLGGMSGYDFLGKVRRQWPDLPVLMITAYATPKLAVEVIKAGAIDYLAKPFAPEELLHAVARCAERYRLLQDNARLRAHATETYRLEQIVGDCAKMRELRQLIQTVAPTDARVLILGESGTGKELVAGALHSLGRGKSRNWESGKPKSESRNQFLLSQFQLSAFPPDNYVRINCAAIPEALLESELFGHEKGAFTGAVKQKLGRVEEADDGTIFLDEIADMSGPLQAKLLRFLEDGTFTRVGGTQELRVNVRLIAATNRDIVQAIADKQFREDLFHRLNVVQFRLPPLRERGEDVLLLAEHFLKMFGVSMNKNLHPVNYEVTMPSGEVRRLVHGVKAISRAAQQKLMAHHWPGNVRELRNVIERALILETASEIEPGCLPDFHLEARLHKTETAKAAGLRLVEGGCYGSESDTSLDELLGGFERDLINATLDQNHYNLTKTAERLKISRHALRYRMQRLNIASPVEGDEGAAVPAGKEVRNP